MDLENNVKLPNPYHCMVTPGFAKGTDGSSWGWTVLPAHAAVWTNSTEPASCALLHEGGQNPCPHLALNFIFALYMHTKRVKKPGWKQRKEGCSPKNERSCCLLSGHAGEGFATCRGNKANLHPSLPAVAVMETAILGLNWTILTACANSSTIKRNLFPQEEAPLGPVLGSEPEDVPALCYCGTQIAQEASAAEFQTRKTWQCFQCRELQDREGSAQVPSYTTEHIMLLLGLPGIGSLEYLIDLVCGVHLLFISSWFTWF